jgi:deazaflavin-dependent oxidoreductase (nitroreductase family)
MMPIGNALVRGVLRSPLHRVLSRSLLLLVYRGRRTGREYTVPVGYVRDGDELIVLVGEAHLKSWWRNFRGPERVEVVLGGRRLAGEARVVTGAEAVPRLATYLEGMPRAAKALDVPRRADGRPDPEAFADADRDLAVVVVRLDAGGAQRGGGRASSSR